MNSQSLNSQAVEGFWAVLARLWTVLGQQRNSRNTDNERLQMEENMKMNVSHTTVCEASSTSSRYLGIGERSSSSLTTQWALEILQDTPWLDKLSFSAIMSEMLLFEHPDSAITRFLCHVDWHIGKAVRVMIEAMRRRLRELEIGRILESGEAGAVSEAASEDRERRKCGKEFMALIRSGPCFLQGADTSGNTILHVRCEKYVKSDYSSETVKKYILFMIDTALRTVRPGRALTFLFDMTNFRRKNMDFSAVTLLIECIQKVYIGYTGVLLLHNAPWMFKAIWSSIWVLLKPSTRQKVHFTTTTKDLERFIALDEFPKHLGGRLKEDYEYIEPVKGENWRLSDFKTKKLLQDERADLILELLEASVRWVGSKETSIKNQTRNRMEVLWKAIEDNSRVLDPYIRARALYDRLELSRTRP